MTMADGLLRFFFAHPIDVVRDASSLVAAFSVACCIPVAIVERSNITIRFLPTLVGVPRRASGRRSRGDPGRDHPDPDDVAVRAVRRASQRQRQRHLDAADPDGAGLGGCRCHSRRQRAAAGGGALKTLRGDYLAEPSPTAVD